MMEPAIELNAAIARDVMHWASLGAHLWRDRESGEVYYTGQDPTRVFVPHTVFQPSSDLSDMRLVEAQITRRGTWQAYMAAVIRELHLEEHVINAAYATGYPTPEEAPIVRQVLQQATLTQRCRAAWEALHDVS